MQSVASASGPETVLLIRAGRGYACFEWIEVGFWGWGAVRSSYRPAKRKRMVYGKVSTH